MIGLLYFPRSIPMSGPAHRIVGHALLLAVLSVSAPVVAADPATRAKPSGAAKPRGWGVRQVPVADYYGILVKRLDLARGDRFHWTRPAYDLLAHCAATRIAEALDLSLPKPSVRTGK
jgi:hypothetical protein